MKGQRFEDQWAHRNRDNNREIKRWREIETEQARERDGERDI